MTLIKINLVLFMVYISYVVLILDPSKLQSVQYYSNPSVETTRVIFIPPHKLNVYTFIQHISQEVGVEENILIAMIFTENEKLEGTPKSYNPDDIGFVQLNKGSFKDFETYCPEFNPYNIEHNLIVSAKYIKWLLDREGITIKNIARAYNQGIGNVWKNRSPNNITLEHTKRFNTHYSNLQIKTKKWEYIKKLILVENWRLGDDNK